MNSRLYDISSVSRWICPIFWLALTGRTLGVLERPEDATHLSVFLCDTTEWHTLGPAGLRSALVAACLCHQLEPHYVQTKKVVEVIPLPGTRSPPSLLQQQILLASLHVTSLLPVTALTPQVHFFKHLRHLSLLSCCALSFTAIATWSLSQPCYLT